MYLTSDNKFKKLVVIGDRVLIRSSQSAVLMPEQEEEI
jgi:hypothetical protein